MVSYRPPLDGVLDALKGTAHMYVADYDGKGEWFRLKSRLLAEEDLFRRLERNWRMLVGANGNRFALLLVESGKDAGIWLHFFPTLNVAAQYEPGCHRLPSWF